MFIRLSAVLLALVAGALLLDAVALVPFWEALPPAGVSAWFSRHAWRIDWLTGVLVVLAVLAAFGGLVQAWSDPRARLRMGLALAAAAGLAAIGGFFHWPTARLLATPDGVPAARLPTVLWQWSAWEWVRVLLAAGGCWAAIGATGPFGPPAKRKGARAPRKAGVPRARKSRPPVVETQI